MGTTGFSELFIIGEVQQGVDLSISRGSEGFSCGSAGKDSACSARDLHSIPGLGRSPGEGIGYPLQYSGLENSMDWTVHVVAKSWTRLNDFQVRLLYSAMPVTPLVFIEHPLYARCCVRHWGEQDRHGPSTWSWLCSRASHLLSVILPFLLPGGPICPMSLP